MAWTLFFLKCRTIADGIKAFPGLFFPWSNKKEEEWGKKHPHGVKYHGKKANLKPHDVSPEGPQGERLKLWGASFWSEGSQVIFSLKNAVNPIIPLRPSGSNYLPSLHLTQITFFFFFWLDRSRLASEAAALGCRDLLLGGSTGPWGPLHRGDRRPIRNLEPRGTAAARRGRWPSDKVVEEWKRGGLPRSPLLQHQGSISLLGLASAPFNWAGQPRGHSEDPSHFRASCGYHRTW